MTDQRRILHCLRAPVGGLFRHVCDLTRAQSDAGHKVGIICDSRTGGDIAGEALEHLEPHCALGIKRVSMSRQVGLHDITATRAVRRFAIQAEAQILHGHGAKGGAYARLAANRIKKRGIRISSFYTPHGGSLHYDPAAFSGRVFLALERQLGSLTDGLLFESQYSADLYAKKVMPFPCPATVVPNGLWPEEFMTIAPEKNAADFLFIGELRHLKGVDVLLNAVAGLQQKDQKVPTATIVGSGPDDTEFRQLADHLQLGDSVTFTGPMPAREAFPLGRCLVLPSRAESFPYIVLEAAAAKIPMILTHVGGIPEIVAGTSIELTPPGDIASLTAQMEHFLHDSSGFADKASELQSRVSSRYQANQMARAILESYETAIRA